MPRSLPMKPHARLPATSLAATVPGASYVARRGPATEEPRAGRRFPGRLNWLLPRMHAREAEAIQPEGERDAADVDCRQLEDEWFQGRRTEPGFGAGAAAREG